MLIDDLMQVTYQLEDDNPEFYRVYGPEIVRDLIAPNIPVLRHVAA